MMEITDVEPAAAQWAATPLELLRGLANDLACARAIACTWAGAWGDIANQRVSRQRYGPGDPGGCAGPGLSRSAGDRQRSAVRADS